MLLAAELQCVPSGSFFLLTRICYVFCFRTMKAGMRLVSALVLFLLMGAVSTQRFRKPIKRPATDDKSTGLEQPEPKEPTDFPPVILGPPSVYSDCPRECFCSPSYQNSLNCENRNIRVIPAIPARTHYLYLQNNYITEVTEEAFANATDVRWINLANNRIHRINKQVRKLLQVVSMIWYFIENIAQHVACNSLLCRCSGRSQRCCTSMHRVTI